MVDYNAPLYQFKAEVWDEEKCKTMARGKGYLGSSASMPPQFGEIRYNGGCCHDDKWWQGEFRPFPVIPESYEIIHVTSWGWYIRKKKEKHE